MTLLHGLMRCQMVGGPLGDLHNAPGTAWEELFKLRDKYPSLPRRNAA